MKPAKHIQILLDAEDSTQGEYRGCIRFDRTGKDTIVVSCSGYNHQDLYDVEAALLKAGCRYDVAKGIQKFDRVCGRTFTHFKEPKAGA